MELFREGVRRAGGGADQDRARRSGRSSSTSVYIIGTVGLSPAVDGRAHRQEQHGQRARRGSSTPRRQDAGHLAAVDVLLQGVEHRQSPGSPAPAAREPGRRSGSTHARVHRPPVSWPCFTVWAISVLSFVIIQLPPGDYVTSYIAQMAAIGQRRLRARRRQNLRAAVRPRPARSTSSTCKWMGLVAAGQLRHGDGVEAARSPR